MIKTKQNRQLRLIGHQLRIQDISLQHVDQNDHDDHGDHLADAADIERDNAQGNKRYDHAGYRYQSEEKNHNAQAHDLGEAE